ncbi:MAG: zinc-ribbon domain-containing protein [Deltaproteobacteria bacterium]|nr:zinc-ribbon domain-containing protein [Deltaproteobacteria bacterium]
MDVICQNCGTEYDFDETLVSERGTTVKCTQCAHLFKVYRPGGGDARPWSIRHRDGREELVPTLRDLQKLIATNVLSEFDEIARQGDAYKPLGSIAELATFFSQARASRPDSSPPAARTSSIPAGAPGPRRSKGTLMGYSPGSEPVTTPQLHGNSMPGAPRQSEVSPAHSPSLTPASVPPPPLPPASVPPPSASMPSPAPGPAQPRPIAKPPEPERANPAAAAAAKASHRAIAATRASDMLEEPIAPPVTKSRAPVMQVDDDDDVKIKGVGSPKWGRWVFLVALIALGVVGYLQRDAIMAQVQALRGPPPDPAASFLEEAEELLRRDDADGYRQGIHEMIRATAVAERDPRVLTMLSRGYSLKAQLHEFDAQDLVADAGEDPARLAEAAGLRHVARDAAQEARHKAEDAVREAPDSVEARVALADALRLTGDLIGARRHYERSRDLAPTASADQLTVGALLAAAEQEDLGAAVELAQQAVGADAGLIRARIVLARALLASGNGEAARAHVAHVLASQADHAGALAVRRRLDGEAPQPAAAEEPELAPAVVVDAGVAVDPSLSEGQPRVGADGTTEGRDNRTFDEMQAGGTDTSGTRPPAGTDVAMDDGRPPEGRDYSWYIQNGDTALSGGNLSRADAFYQAALEVRPGSSEATTGLANVMLRRGRADDAVVRFRAATRQGYGPAFIGLGRANESLGRRSEAIQAYEDYLQRSPSGSLATTARQRLEALRPTPAPGPAPTPTPTVEDTPPPPPPPPPAPEGDPAPGPA